MTDNLEKISADKVNELNSRQKLRDVKKIIKSKELNYEDIHREIGELVTNRLSKEHVEIWKKENSSLFLIGKTFGHLEQSCFLKENYQIFDGMPPEVNLLNEKNNGETLLKLIKNNLVLSSHDVSNGGLIVTLSEMAVLSEYGVKIKKPKILTNLFNYFFGEDQARYVVEIEKKNTSKAEKIMKDNDIYFENIGYTQKEIF